MAESASCIYCPDPPGVTRGSYGMSPEGLATMKREHDAGHPEIIETRSTLSGRSLLIASGYAWPPQYRIVPTSCRCGGSLAWLQKKLTGAWEMIGCVCHNTPLDVINVTLEEREND